MTKETEISKLKKEYLKYYKDVPIYRYAAAHIGRDEDTCLIWRNEDSDFSEQIEKARADFAKRHLKKVDDDKWILERVLRSGFQPPKQDHEHTGKVKLDVAGVLKIIQDERSNNKESS